MEKKEFIKCINKEIVNGLSILERFKSLKVHQGNYGDGMAVIGAYPKPQINPEERAALNRDLTLWERRVYDVLKCYFGEEKNSPLYEFHLSETDKWFSFKDFGINCMDTNLTTLRSYIERIDVIKVPHLEEKQDKTIVSEDKPFKVFISHSSEDIAFVNELVKLLEFLCVDSSEKLLCSSIKGYQIPTSEDFAEYILKQFYDYNLFVIIVHSHNYYSSPYSLNEMGAAWVLKKDFFSFLVKGFEYNDMEGVINQRAISVKVDVDEAGARLNELKNKLIPLFKRQGVNESRWETLRDEFLEKVNTLQSSNDTASEDLFLTCYIPVFDKVLSFVDMPNYPYWTFNWAMAGTSKISVERYDKLEELNSFLQRISYHQGYEVYDNLLRNLGILVSDYIDLCNEHIKEFGTEEYTIDRFYTKIPDNPNYENLLNEFNEYCRLICDMTLELTRLLNLLLERIRERVPDYHIDEGIFVIDSIAREKTQYRNSEKSDTPYPGLKQFVKIRKTRNYCYSKTEELGFLY